MTLIIDTLNEEYTNIPRTNSERIADTYYEYHGCHDEGNTPVESYAHSKGVVIA